MLSGALFGVLAKPGAEDGIPPTAITPTKLVVGDSRLILATHGVYLSWGLVVQLLLALLSVVLTLWAGSRGRRWLWGEEPSAGTPQFDDDEEPEEPAGTGSTAGDRAAGYAGCLVSIRMPTVAGAMISPRRLPCVSRGVRAGGVVSCANAKGSAIRIHVRTSKGQCPWERASQRIYLLEL